MGVAMDSLVTQEGWLLPVVDEDSIAFWEGTRAGKLLIQSCSNCNKFRFPPRPMCPNCQSLDSQWIPSIGTGTIWSFVIAHPPLLDAYAKISPYNVIVVSLDDDQTIRLVGNLIEESGAQLNSVEHTKVEIGAKVQVVFDKLNEEFTLPRWVLTST